MVTVKQKDKIYYIYDSDYPAKDKIKCQGKADMERSLYIYLNIINWTSDQASDFIENLKIKRG